MNILLTCCQISNESITVKILELTIPFILGLLASLIVDKLRNKIRNKKNKNFVKTYLRDSVLKNVISLKSDYETIKKKIETLESDSKNIISAYEDFNINVLNGISSVEYYSAFKKQFVLLNEIISMIEFLSQNLPIVINNDFYNDVNTHLKEINKIGDKEHVMECERCKQRKIATIVLLENRIKETDLLKLKIEELIK